MKRFSLFAAIALVAVLASSAQANLLDDGSFDDAMSGSTTSNSDWVLTINMPDGVDRAAQFQTGFANANNTGVGGTQAPGTGTGIWFRSFEGDQGNSGEPLAQADITQSVIAPADGDYTLSFRAGREVNHLSREFGVSLTSSGTGGSAMIDLNAAVIPDGNLGGAASGNPMGTPFSISLSGVTAGDVLTVSGFMVDGEDTVIPGGQSAFLDNFVLQVPEPTSAMLLSLGFVGFLGRRRKA
ncbi:MAG: PEP-CTERM sorting domain-containing protein [Lacipirellulaceae bacterium]